MASLSARLVGHVRLTHPFPSLLDGLVVAGAAVVAGGGGETAVRLAVSMVLLQASVGSLNDLVDAPRDAGNKPGKPIPAGLVTRPVAWGMVTAAALAGVGLAIPSGTLAVALAVGLLGLGYAYDLWFKGTVWSWLPFAIAIPLFPTYGWVGAAGGVPAVWAILVPAAVLAGAGLAIANARVDVERDEAVGVRSVATWLGVERAWSVQSVLLGLVVVAAITSLLLAAAPAPALVGCIVAAIGMGVGIVLGRSSGAAAREGAWRIQAIAIGGLAAAWLAGIRAAGLA